MYDSEKDIERSVEEYLQSIGIETKKVDVSRVYSVVDGPNPAEPEFVEEDEMLIEVHFYGSKPITTKIGYQRFWDSPGRYEEYIGDFRKSEWLMEDKPTNLLRVKNILNFSPTSR
jgi:hypothetical protein